MNHGDGWEIEKGMDGVVKVRLGWVFVLFCFSFARVCARVVRSRLFHDFFGGGVPTGKGMEWDM